MITLTINGQEVQAEKGTTVLEAAEAMGVKIPTLCYHKALEPAGLCRLCTVEVFDGRRTRFVTSCNYPVKNGIQVQTHSEKVKKHRKMIVELLLARCPDSDFMKNMAAEYGIEKPRFACDADNCILCGLCHRVCELMGPNGITFAGRGTDIEVTPPFHRSSETCIACGACAAVCPTGNIKMLDEGDEIVIKIGDIEINRAKKQKCEVCGEYYAPAVFLQAIEERVAASGADPAAGKNICQKCCRDMYAKQAAEGYI